MKVFVTPTGLHSRAMIRVVEALRAYAPPGVEFVGRARDADVQIAHVIAPFSLHEIQAKEFVVIQYCLFSAFVENRINSEEIKSIWKTIWDRSRFVWSYYNLHEMIGSTPFYYSPLGVDGKIFHIQSKLRNAVMTSGFVTGPGAEPIEEVSRAAETLGMPILHLGPPTIQGMNYYPRHRQVFLSIEDDKLVDIYNQSKWVSGMRFIEGFEMPVIEGLACGSRPICFDRPDMRQWYNDHAVFVPESSGKNLQDALELVMAVEPTPVSAEERNLVLQKFNWENIANGFWQAMNV